MALSSLPQNMHGFDAFIWLEPDVALAGQLESTRISSASRPSVGSWNDAVVHPLVPVELTGDGRPPGYRVGRIIA